LLHERRGEERRGEEEEICDGLLTHVTAQGDGSPSGRPAAVQPGPAMSVIVYEVGRLG